MRTIKTCPTCSSGRIKRVRKAVHGAWEGTPFTAKGIEFYECPDCGEKVYDQAAMQKIQLAYPRRRPGARRKAS